MTLASISSGSTAAAYRNPAVFQTRAIRRREADEDDTAPAQASSQAQRSDGPGRRNPLVAAMMSALQSLMPSSTSTTPKATATATAATTPAASTTTATPTAGTTPATTTTADPATALREAAYAFAHELYSALRGDGASQGSGEDGGEHHHRHHHHHHRSEGSGGYGDLAQRLTALAQKLDGGSAAPAVTATPATTPPSAAATPAATTTTATPATTSATPAVAATTPAATPAASGTTINITININLGGTAAAGPAATPAAKTASSPLVDAFKHMFEALNPAGAAATTGPSPSERLSAFLRQMAQSLSKGSADTQPVSPTSGSLLNVSA